MEREPRKAETTIRDLASQAHGVVTRRELLEGGSTPAQVRSRVEKGLLTPVHRGVYRVGHLAPSVEARYMAAVKAARDEALLCGRAAAYLRRLIKGPAPKPEVLTRDDRRIPGIVVHRARRAVAERTGRLAIPLTTIPRTLVDLGMLPGGRSSSECCAGMCESR